MKKWDLTEGQKEKILAYAIIVIGVLVMLGQLIDTQLAPESDWMITLRTYIDPIQYMIGMLSVNLILVYSVIKKYEQIQNPFLNTLKWYFSLLFLNDFIVLFLRIVQNNNLVGLKSSLAMGIGKTYMIMVTVRSLTDLTFTAAASLLLVYGLNRYSALYEQKPAGLTGLGKVMCWTVVVYWLVSIPASFSLFLSSRLLFGLSLGLGQFGQAAVAAMVYWTVKENYQKYRTKFFRYLNHYYAIALFIAGLVLTYSVGSMGVLQRLPAGENPVFSGFGSVVFFCSRLAYIVTSYLIYLAITNYREAPNPSGQYGLKSDL